MRLEGCVKKDIMMNLEGPHAYCMFISIGLLPLKMMSADAHNMMMSAKAHSMMMSANVHSMMMSANTHRMMLSVNTHRMMMRVFIRRMTLFYNCERYNNLFVLA